MRPCWASRGRVEGQGEGAKVGMSMRSAAIRGTSALSPSFCHLLVMSDRQPADPRPILVPWYTALRRPVDTRLSKRKEAEAARGKLLSAAVGFAKGGGGAAWDLWRPNAVHPREKKTAKDLVEENREPSWCVVVQHCQGVVELWTLTAKQ